MSKLKKQEKGEKVKDEGVKPDGVVEGVDAEKEAVELQLPEEDLHHG